MSANVVTLTMDAKLGPAQRAFKQLGDEILRNKGSAKDLTRAVRDVGKEYKDQASAAKQHFSGQLDQLKSMAVNWISIATAIRLAKAALDGYQQGLQTNATAGQNFLRDAQKLRGLVSPDQLNAVMATTRNQAAANHVTLGTAFAARRAVEASTPSLDFTKRTGLTDTAIKLARAHGDTENAAAYGDLAAVAGENFKGYTGLQQSNALEALIADGASPEDTKKLLLGFASGGGTLEGAAAFSRLTNARFKSSKQGLSLLNDIQRVQSTKAPRGSDQFAKLQRLGISRDANVEQNISGLAGRLASGQLTKADLIESGISPDSIPALENLGNLQGVTKSAREELISPIQRTRIRRAGEVLPKLAPATPEDLLASRLSYEGQVGELQAASEALQDAKLAEEERQIGEAAPSLEVLRRQEDFARRQKSLYGEGVGGLLGSSQVFNLGGGLIDRGSGGQGQFQQPSAPGMDIEHEFAQRLVDEDARETARKARVVQSTSEDRRGAP